jgi:hypothetical protein
MANYVYLIGSTKTKEVAVVDPAWEIDRVVELAQADGMRWPMRSRGSRSC